MGRTLALCGGCEVSRGSHPQSKAAHGTLLCGLCTRAAFRPLWGRGARGRAAARLRNDFVYRVLAETYVEYGY